MAQIYVNAAAGTLTADPGAAGTTLDSAEFANLPTVAAPDFLYITLDPTGVDGLPEIVKITTHTAAATSVTVTRYSETQTGLLASSGRSHAIATIWRAAATKATLDNLAGLTPAGTIRATIRATADTGWLLGDQTVVGAETDYPALWAVAPAAWKSGSDLAIPDLSDIFLMGAGTTTLGALGGANSKTIAEANLPTHTHTGPSHTHTIDHDHGSVTSGTESATHTHDLVATVSGTPGGSNVAVQTGGGYGYSTSLTESATHTHAVDLPNFTGTSGASGTGATGNGGFANTALDVTPAHLAVTFQIKAH